MRPPCMYIGNITPVTFSEHSLVPASRGKYWITFSALDQTVFKPSHASADRWTDAVLSWKKLDFHSILQTSPLISLKTNGPSVSLTLPATTFTDTWLWTLCALLGWKTLEATPLHSNRKTEERKDPYPTLNKNTPWRIKLTNQFDYLAAYENNIFASCIKGTDRLLTSASKAEGTQKATRLTSRTV